MERTPASVASGLKTLVISENGRDWKPVPTESLPGNRVRLTVIMPGPTLYVAGWNHIGCPTLTACWDPSVTIHAVQITNIGRTAGGRDLEIIQIGTPCAVSRLPAGPGASVGVWQQLDGPGTGAASAERGCRDERISQRYTVYILPMANKDGVARGMTRFNGKGKDLNGTGTSRPTPIWHRKTPRSSGGWSG